MMDLKTLVEKKRFSVVEIGTEVLRQLGYTVKISGVGYSSLYIQVFSPDGKLLYEEAIGE
ncbi:hypothetical protein [Thermoanaerobacterium thermosaccharolyticum]|uniref:hypothetical protein n=1 Tax=Thermoanaerobacterium thermosaccharolyticum TaxID=1517 RepID=UPI00177E670F|nr:hypothetical protein [Thermoanaerobacterium thermosaccharolyticum]MBE0069920.1 hypothetical protein [Thermoanaerobacterium thermosaccharolyticum]MBE0228048.1 hypothetical protein [Thermoanaerobacterium thermosaccharolyticum]